MRLTGTFLRKIGWHSSDCDRFASIFPRGAVLNAKNLEIIADDLVIDPEDIIRCLLVGASDEVDDEVNDLLDYLYEAIDSNAANNLEIPAAVMLGVLFNLCNWRVE